MKCFLFFGMEEEWQIATVDRDKKRKLCVSLPGHQMPCFKIIYMHVKDTKK